MVISYIQLLTRKCCRSFGSCTILQSEYWKTPSTWPKKTDIENWLGSKGIEYEEGMARAELDEPEMDKLKAKVYYNYLLTVFIGKGNDTENSVS